MHGRWALPGFASRRCLYKPATLLLQTIKRLRSLGGAGRGADPAGLKSTVCCDAGAEGGWRGREWPGPPGRASSADKKAGARHGTARTCVGGRSLASLLAPLQPEVEPEVEPKVGLAMIDSSLKVYVPCTRMGVTPFSAGQMKILHCSTLELNWLSRANLNLILQICTQTTTTATTTATK